MVLPKAAGARGDGEPGDKVRPTELNHRCIYMMMCFITKYVKVDTFKQNENKNARCQQSRVYVYIGPRVPHYV